MFKKGSPFVSLFNEAIWANRLQIEMIKRKYLDHQAPLKCAVDKIGPEALSRFLGGEKAKELVVFSNYTLLRTVSFIFHGHVYGLFCFWRGAVEMGDVW